MPSIAVLIQLQFTSLKFILEHSGPGIPLSSTVLAARCSGPKVLPPTVGGN